MTTLIVLDEETTGLNPAKHHLLEIAIKVVDSNDLDTVIESLHLLINPESWSILDTMDPVVWRMHTTNGLLHDCAVGGMSPAEAATHIANLLKRYPKNLIAGNSPHAVDRPFLAALFAKQGWRLDDFTSHRMLDVTSTGYAFEAIGLPLPEAATSNVGTHRAMDDVDNCLRQLRSMRDTYAPIVDMILHTRSLQTIEDSIEGIRDRIGGVNLSAAEERLKTKKKKPAGLPVASVLVQEIAA